MSHSILLVSAITFCRFDVFFHYFLEHIFLFFLGKRRNFCNRVGCIAFLRLMVSILFHEPVQTLPNNFLYFFRCSLKGGWLVRV